MNVNPNNAWLHELMNMNLCFAGTLSPTAFCCSRRCEDWAKSDYEDMKFSTLPLPLPLCHQTNPVGLAFHQFCEHDVTKPPHLLLQHFPHSKNCAVSCLVNIKSMVQTSKLSRLFCFLKVSQHRVLRLEFKSPKIALERGPWGDFLISCPKGPFSC